jgi:hypothetical protein
MNRSILAKYSAVFSEEPGLRGRHYGNVLDEVRRRAKRKARKAAAKKVKKAKKRKKGRLPKPAKDEVQKKSTGASQHNPFKRHSSLGPTSVYKTPPAPPKPSDTRTHRRRNRWSCTGEGLPKYYQKCVGIGDKKGKSMTIHIKPDYKTTYNKAYKRHRTKKRAEAKASGKKNRYSPH